MLGETEIKNITSKVDNFFLVIPLHKFLCNFRIKASRQFDSKGIYSIYFSCFRVKVKFLRKKGSAFFKIILSTTRVLAD